MSFLDQRLPTDVERGAQGGPRFNTSVVQLSSGHERRNAEWSRVRGEWDISYGITRRSQLEAVIAMFYVSQGRKNGFRFKDWSDHAIGKPGDAATRQQIGVGDGSTTAFQVFKRYSVGAASYDRVIKKLVDGTVTVYLNGSEATPTIDHSTGEITFSSPPGGPGSGGDGPNGEDVVSVVCEFDVPVRFDQDDLPISTEVHADEPVIELPQIKLVELRT